MCVATCSVPHGIGPLYMHHELVLCTCIRIGPLNIHLVRIGALKVHKQCTLAQHTVYTWQRIDYIHHNMRKARMHSHNLYLASEKACNKAFLFGITIAQLLIILYVSSTKLCDLCTTCHQSLYAHIADTEHMNMPPHAGSHTLMHV